MAGKRRGAEAERLAENNSHRKFWKKWGPYLSERQWGTVREDYSADGDAWAWFPHDHARSRVYRWGEDGLCGISDIRQDICFALALWNGRDRILKERLFGLSNSEGNHGEDVKELYYYLDNTPTHSYMKMLYKYPQAAFPYEELIEINRGRSRSEPEYELIDTGIFDDDRYFDLFVEYAKADPDDILIRISVHNRSAEPAGISVLPSLWFRNTWAFGNAVARPDMKVAFEKGLLSVIEAAHPEAGTWFLHAEGAEQCLFTENETNTERLYGAPNCTPFVKDAFHDAVISGNMEMLAGKRSGTKAALLFRFVVPARGAEMILLRLSSRSLRRPFGERFGRLLQIRKTEADAFFEQFIPDAPLGDAVQVQRQAYAGLLWSKQYYNYEVDRWLEGDPGMPHPPEARKRGRNGEWTHLFNRDIISMPDKWEYPWYASWDLAFHCVPLSVIDPDFAKKQLVLFLREWYMHPNGQIPAFEWNLGNVNPPVHAWAALKVYNLEKERSGRGDIVFLKRVFHKLLLNFTWWVNKKDSGGRNIFQGGFLGLDNIGIFDRSRPAPGGGRLEQADGTSWMAMYALNLMDMALEIAMEDPSYEDVASKFFEHFVHIAESFNAFGHYGLWDEEDGFYYDALHLPGGLPSLLRVRSLVGLTPLFAVSVVKREVLDRFPGFTKRMVWFRNHREERGKCFVIDEFSADNALLLSLTPKDRLTRILRRIFDEAEFLSPGGIRSLSRHHKGEPFLLRLNGDEYRIEYEPGESKTELFGGNSNWRGPIWVPMNYLLIEALKKYYFYYQETFKVEFPTGAGEFMDLREAAKRISQRLTGIFTRDGEGRRLVHGSEERYRRDPHFRDLALFYEYFDADTCRGLGASHQTGWTGLVAEMIEWCWCFE